MIDLSHISLTTDTREKDTQRIKAISQYFRERGAKVSSFKLDTLDYHIEGMYKDKYVNLGIEYKTGSDFAGNRDELNDRFARASLEYLNVGFVIEHDYNRIIDQDTKYTEVTLYEYIVDWETKRTLYDNYHGLHNALRTYEREGILTAEIKGVYEFPRICIAFMNYIVADDHKGMYFDNHNPINILMKIPGIGVDKADKMIKEFGSIYNVMNASEDELKMCIGVKSCERFLEYIRKCE